MISQKMMGVDHEYFVLKKKLGAFKMPGKQPGVTKFYPKQVLNISTPNSIFWTPPPLTFAKTYL